ncbi:dihydrouridine synthase [Candidatus Dojkabacteria bacterium HGW-Dojkabacteria-1]|uniref:tRNA-dihydrouridine synthase n=1 Tax=Candidatus Dojkabacteria bacterium HGW-Dojkabacteria-1 TaxID=2013761 RepID=A0A2N2F455_9BACT|nr:MAG: dihydrouridine synthase [Candidatus Dojkabacteria bacterium HGW-Dojkabacteria-1]
MNIYDEIKKPIIALSPMEDVTDTVFRQIVMSVGRPDVFFTEFVNVEGLNSKGKEKVIHRLQYTKEEKPIVAQLWGVKPENFLYGAKLVKEMGFEGVDINMGCSVKNVVKNNAGSGLINADRQLVVDIIKATKEGAQDIPVSVKTRLGFEYPDIEGWIGFLLEQQLDLLTVHMRTAKGEGAIHANWEYTEEIVKLRNQKNSSTLLFGNGDIKSIKQGKELSEKYKIDGVMIGREAIYNPWVFSEREEISQKEKFILFEKHLQLFEKTWGESKDFHSLKKFFKAYVNDFGGSALLRSRLMSCNDFGEVSNIIDEELKNI